MPHPLFWSDDVNTITWIQHAIGQGGFHSGQLINKDGIRFNWIFDCGAKNSKQFENYLLDWTRRLNEPVDWLFISHFDFDHVSGLNTLMSRCVIQDVMIPYVNDEELAYVLLSEIARGNLDRTLVELIADPASFFLSRGANRIIFLNGGRPMEPGGREDREPPEPPDESTAGEDGRGWTIRISKPVAALTTPAWAHSASGPSRVGIVNGGTCAVTIVRGSIGLRLMPYRAPITQTAHSQLLVDVQNLVKHALSSWPGRPGLRGLAYAIAQHARTPNGRAELRTLHKNHAGSSNRASLSLLSEPFNFDPLRAYCNVNYPFDHFSTAPNGVWINTGDAELLAPTDLNDWQKCYSTSLADVRVLALPHHGSDKNSDGNLQVLCPKALFTAHVKSTSKKHPGANVSLTAGKRLACVSEKKSTEVLMKFYSH